MKPRIAIPEPTSLDSEYNERSLPPYVDALEAAGAEPVVISLREPQAGVARVLADVQGVLLPGCRYDVEPERYGEKRIPACGEADPARTAVDELLLQDAFGLHKPILAICHGAQSLNVWRNGTLFQDLPSQGKSEVNHAPGRHIAEAHPVHIAGNSRLGALLSREEETQVNSSHHQAVRVAGDNLKVTAVSPVDGVIEAVELDSPDHFVVGVQWHPERTYESSAFSRAIFREFVGQAEKWRVQPIEESTRRSGAAR